MGERIRQLQNISKYYYSDSSVTRALRRANLEFNMAAFFVRRNIQMQPGRAAEGDRQGCSG